MLAVSILGLQDDSKYELLDRSNCDFIHLDIMDGFFVNNKKEYTSNYKFNKPLDVHLMVNDVLDYIDKYLYLNPYRISFHIETNIDIKEAISKLKSSNIKVGLAINPTTSINNLIPYINDIDSVLVMSVEPGLGGQPYIENTTLKIQELKELKNEYNASFDIEVDGGINNTNYKTCGADIMVVGNYITKSDDILKEIDELKKL